MSRRVSRHVSRHVSRWTTILLLLGVGLLAPGGRAAPAQDGPCPGPAAPALILSVYHYDARLDRERGALIVEVVLRVTGFQTRRTADGGIMMDLLEDMETLTSDGQRIGELSRDGVERRKQVGAGVDAAQDFVTSLAVNPKKPAGIYRVRLTVHDLIGGRRQSREVRFSLPPDTP